MRKIHFMMMLFAAMTWLLWSSGVTFAGEEEALKVGKRGHITFDTETKVGDQTLPAGRYLLQHRVEGGDHFVHFQSVSQGAVPGGPRGAKATKSAHHDTKCKMEPLGKKASRTAVYTRKGQLTRIEIKGENVAHLF